MPISFCMPESTAKMPSMPTAPPPVAPVASMPTTLRPFWAAWTHAVRPEEPTPSTHTSQSTVSSTDSGAHEAAFVSSIWGSSANAGLAEPSVAMAVAVAIDRPQTNLRRERLVSILFSNLSSSLFAHRRCVASVRGKPGALPQK